MKVSVHHKIVCPSFLPHLLNFKRYEVYYGGRGSSKSTFVARKLILRSRLDRYFRCIYSRKNSEHIRDSQFSLLKSQIRALKLEHEFKILEGTMKIVHLSSGNEFIAKGLNDPEKVKSIDEPSHLWCEEITEFDIEDFLTLDKSIRTKKSENCSIVTFNPVHESNWVRNHFFDKENPHNANPEFGNNILVHRSTYKDNIFIDQESYYKTLLISAAGNANRIRVDVEGDWGLMENKSPWLYAFDEDKNVKDDLPFLPSFPIYVFTDVNNDPLEGILVQVSPQAGRKDSFIHIFDMYSESVKANQNDDGFKGSLAYQVGTKIKQKHPYSIFYLGGDRSGNNEDTGRNQTFYQIMGKALDLRSPKQYLANTYNLEHYDSQVLCNTMFYNYPNLYISRKTCSKLIEQCNMAQVDDKAKKAGTLLKDRGTYKLDAFDAMRYMFQALFNDFAKTNYLKVR